MESFDGLVSAVHHNNELGDYFLWYGTQVVGIRHPLDTDPDGLAYGYAGQASRRLMILIR